MIAAQPLTRTDPRWADFADLLGWLAIMFGKPGELAEQVAVRRETGLLLRGWLRGLEAILRALLVTLACELHPHGAAQSRAKRARKRPSAERAEKKDGPRSYESERWLGVGFSLLPPPEPQKSGGTRPEPKDWLRPTIETRALAFRFEALIRVAESPERYARRMAELLRKRSDAAARILAPPPREWPHGCRPFPRHDVEEAQRDAHAALALLDSG